MHNELLIYQLRSQVREIQSLLAYLESREQLRHEDYTYSESQLARLIQQLRQLKRVASQGMTATHLQTQWLN